MLKGSILALYKVICDEKKGMTVIQGAGLMYEMYDNKSYFHVTSMQISALNVVCIFASTHFYGL